jgi:hypothetical protein
VEAAVQRVRTLRKVLFRKLIAPVVVAIAAPVLLLTGASGASAVTEGFICETNSGYCVGTPTLNFDDPIIETHGRILQMANVGSSEIDVKFPFNEDPSKCVAVANAGTLVEIRACSVASAVWVVQRGKDGISCIFENQQFGGYLSGDAKGHQYRLEAKNANGWFQQMLRPSGLITTACG